jgi:hypothetical protein
MLSVFAKSAVVRFLSENIDGACAGLSEQIGSAICRQPESLGYLTNRSRALLRELLRGFYRFVDVKRLPAAHREAAMMAEAVFTDVALFRAGLSAALQGIVLHDEFLSCLKTTNYHENSRN